jgi:hypothetical protein
LLRALPGVSLDAYNQTGNAPPADLCLDARPPVIMLAVAGEGDVACGDTRQGQDGWHAPEAVRQRLDAYRRDPSRLAGLHYCTACYTALWSIYGALPDALGVNPLRLACAPDKGQFIEDELALFERAHRSIRPRPLLYIPQTYRGTGRFIEPDELRLLCWSALVGGAKGLKYFAHDLAGPAEQGMAKNPALLAAAAGLGGAVRGREDCLAPLLPVARERLAAPADIELQTAWAGDMGMLLLVRNLRYHTAAESAGDGPCFRCEERCNVVLPVALPPWLRLRGAHDFLSGAELSWRQRDTQTADRPGSLSGAEARVLEITLDRLGAFRLLWLGSRRAPRLLPLPAEPNRETNQPPSTTIMGRRT